jgi:hypothetical protein
MAASSAARAAGRESTNDRVGQNAPAEPNWWMRNA